MLDERRCARRLWPAAWILAAISCAAFSCTASQSEESSFAAGLGGIELDDPLIATWQHEDRWVVRFFEDGTAEQVSEPADNCWHPSDRVWRGVHLARIDGPARI